MKVSVIIPFYNRNQLLRRSVTSVLTQTLPPHEVIVADDCSAEDITWAMKEFPTVIFLRLPKNAGPGGARYHACLSATGTHIATLDSDDYWYPEKLEKQVAFAERINDPRGIYSHQQWVQEDHGGSVRPEDGPRPGEPTTEYLYVRGGFIQSNTFLVEKSLYLELCRVSDRFFADDWELVMRADTFKSQIYVLKEPLSLWNCTSDPQRINNITRKENPLYDINYQPRQAVYFTSKAKAAFRGRYLAPRLMAQGQYWDGGRLLVEAVRAKALSPLAAAKIWLVTMFPRAYAAAVTAYSYFRRKGQDAKLRGPAIRQSSPAT